MVLGAVAEQGNRSDRDRRADDHDHRRAVAEPVEQTCDRDEDDRRDEKKHGEAPDAAALALDPGARGKGWSPLQSMNAYGCRSRLWGEPARQR